MCCFHKGLDSNSILCQFCDFWVHNECSGIIGELEEFGKFKSANQQTDIAKDCLGIELNEQSLGVYWLHKRSRVDGLSSES